jgi:hypothetical protein
MQVPHSLYASAQHQVVPHSALCTLHSALCTLHSTLQLFELTCIHMHTALVYTHHTIDGEGQQGGGVGGTLKRRITPLVGRYYIPYALYYTSRRQVLYPIPMHCTLYYTLSLYPVPCIIPYALYPVPYTAYYRIRIISCCIFRQGSFSCSRR